MPLAHGGNVTGVVLREYYGSGGYHPHPSLPPSRGKGFLHKVTLANSADGDEWGRGLAGCVILRALSYRDLSGRKGYHD